MQGLRRGWSGGHGWWLSGGGALLSSEPRDQTGTAGAKLRAWDGLTEAWELGGDTTRTEEGTAAHPRILAWRVAVHRGAWRPPVHGGRAQRGLAASVHGATEPGTTEAT